MPVIMIHLYTIKLIIHQIRQLLFFLTKQQTDVDVFESILQAAIDRRGLINAVDSNGKFKINAVSNGI